MGSVVSWSSMAVTLFSVSNMIDVIVVVAPFTAHFCILMLFVNMTSAPIAMGCMRLKDALFNHG